MNLDEETQIFTLIPYVMKLPSNLKNISITDIIADKTVNFNIARNRTATTKDRVFDKIFNNQCFSMQ